jgi:hypothetical protein
MKGAKAMRGRTTERTRKPERREAPSKPARMGKTKDLQLAKILEEWLAEARIRYTHAGE